MSDHYAHAERLLGEADRCPDDEKQLRMAAAQACALLALVDAVRPTQGRCANTFRDATGSVLALCELPSGHKGGCREGATEWGHVAAVARDADRQDEATQQAVALGGKDAEIERLTAERSRKSDHVRRLLDDIRGLTQRAETAERERDNYYAHFNQKCRQASQLDQLLKQIADLSAAGKSSLVARIHGIAMSYRTDECADTAEDGDAR